MNFIKRAIEIARIGARIGVASPPRSRFDRMPTYRTQGKGSLNFLCSHGRGARVARQRGAGGQESEDECRQQRKCRFPHRPHSLPLGAAYPLLEWALVSGA